MERAEVKLVIVGDYGVGKTQFLYAIGSANMSAGGVRDGILMIKSKDKVVKIWDTAGEEKYGQVTSVHYRRAIGAMILFDTTKRESFENVPIWIAKLREHAEPSIPIILIGNKIDLTAQRPVCTEEAAEFACRHGLTYFEVSALDKCAVQHAFSSLLEKSLHAHEFNGSFKCDPLNIKVGNSTDFKPWKLCAACIDTRRGSTSLMVLSLFISLNGK